VTVNLFKSDITSVIRSIPGC